MVSAKDGVGKQRPTHKPNIPSTLHTARVPITYQSEDQIPILFVNRSRTHELGRKLRKVYKASPSSRSPGGRRGRVGEGLVEAADDEEGTAAGGKEEGDDVDLLSASPSSRRNDERWKRTGSGGALPLDGDNGLLGDPSYYDSPTRAPLLGRFLHTFADSKRKTPSTPGASQSPESVKRVRFSPVVDDAATAPETPTKKTPTRGKHGPGSSPLSRSVRTPPDISARPASEDMTPTKPTRRTSSRLSGADSGTPVDDNGNDNALSRSELSRERRRLRNERVMTRAGVGGSDAVDEGSDEEEDAGEDKESDEDSGSDEVESDAGSAADEEEERRATDEDEDADFISAQPAHEQYFHLSGPSSTPTKNRTSNATLASLPSVSHADYTRVLPLIPPKHARERTRLVNRHTRQFPHWHHEMLHGFSVALYGFGSKRGLLNEFAEYMGKASVSPVAIFNAFERCVSVKTLVEDLVDGICRAHLTSSGKKLPRTLPAQLALLRSWFGDKPDPSLPYTHLYIIVHNIDAPGLRSDRAQDVLSHLAALPRIHLACSVDHVDAGLLWDGRKHARFRFAWHDCATFEPYDVEARDVVGSLGVVAPEVGAGGKGLKGLVWVMRSLQANVRRIFGVAVKAMMERMDGGDGSGGGEKRDGDEDHEAPDDDSDDSDDQQSKKRPNSRRPGRPGASSSSSALTHQPPSFAIPFSDLFSLCRDQFLASSEQTFRTQLREFLDHGLLRVGRGVGGAEVVWVPAGRKELEKVEGVVKEMG
ncbi:ORC2-domain-containing protein [Gonapodya prolifera JEL478]|uniref:ORC2-domain-containing protein n=1 Tax=Gonapodya prolifera (strain JEL478) TaxID=1344416 RepID=A0A139AIL5_GONPJ|nr:ORC2-domain-containing protein [Gonapodya prolifera JEL478]|eukprot:KXS16637.1 ORC2-domain-containing protein [Gonapodya prolifera JEL478]